MTQNIYMIPFDFLNQVYDLIRFFHNDSSTVQDLFTLVVFRDFTK